jgi:hypothetical protein
MIAQIDSALRAIDHAASQDFKWWFLGLLALGLVALWLMIKLFIKRDERLSNRLDKVQDEHTKTLLDLNTRQAQIIAENTMALGRLAAALEKIADHLPNPRDERPYSNAPRLGG